MKAGLLTITALAAGAAAHAVGHQHQHQHAHKRAAEVVYQYEVVTVTAPAAAPSAPAGYQPPPAPAPAPAPANNPPAYQPPKQNKPPAYQPPKPASTSAAPPPPKQDSPTVNNGTNGLGLTYTPYTSDGGCKSAEQVMADFEKWDGYGLYRIYGVDCNQVCNVIAAVKAKKAKIMLGVFNIANVETEVQTIISEVNGDWSMVDTVSVGNELVNQGTAVEAVLAALDTARSLLTAAGFTGAIVTVDTFNAVIANPQLCEASDYAAINCHAYFDATGTADKAGDFVAMQAQRVKEACGGKRVVVTESGWPYQGDANGNAVASVANQAIALASIKSKFTTDITLFSSLSDHWKKNTAATFNCEQYWGIYDH
ncbi:cell wall glucanase like protein [Zymoseptoria brevis]|uniref:Cell wall glucanase like protein n=1 Tax=Zymoseptoria brevis TaxID=1047168 RepID=A0A0F4GCX7_9PEZI|nr:cell wall glucanase like protein [Zymoseptoria brevis]